MATLTRNLNLDLHNPKTVTYCKTKIVCTIGLRTNTKETIGKLIEAGMNVLRMNFSHGTHEFHASIVKNARDYMKESGRVCALMVDLKGPEIRSGKLKNKTLPLSTGQKIKVTCDTTHIGDENMITLDYQSLCTSVKPGYDILIADGLISLTVLEILNDKELLAVVNNNAVLGETKNVHLPGAIVDLPPISPKDEEDIKFAMKHEVDFIAASFVRQASDVIAIKEMLGPQRDKIHVIAKIESQEGLDNFDEILRVSDGIMVARGDLGVELPMERIFAAQKWMVSKCNAAGKPVITATQMLESMITNPRPTRAECTDVANAVLDGSDCVMLSGETANGDYPVEAVKIMRKICCQAEAVEASMEYSHFFEVLRKVSEPLTIAESIASFSVRTALDVKADLIITITETGLTSRLVSKYRPPVPVIAVTSWVHTAHHLECTRAVVPLLIDHMQSNDLCVEKALELAFNRGLVKKGSRVVIVAGIMEGMPGKTNTLKVLTVGDSAKNIVL
eukprot:GEZU01032636.1.p1 GENE.GEZU01032636.1~~GEZU01032636.1.p1  ORF type:complete len:505 (+),score=213.31 GEZU01032636.1:125-1639(+)